MLFIPRRAPSLPLRVQERRNHIKQYVRRVSNNNIVGSQRKRDCQNENSPFLLPPGGTELCSNFKNVIFMAKFRSEKFQNNQKSQNFDWKSVKSEKSETFRKIRKV